MQYSLVEIAEDLLPTKPASGEVDAASWMGVGLDRGDLAEGAGAAGQCCSAWGYSVST
jgi:hypothetical protein